VTLEAFPAGIASSDAKPSVTITLGANMSAAAYADSAWGACAFDTAPVLKNIPSGTPTPWVVGTPSRLLLPVPGTWLVLGPAYIRANAFVAGNRGMRLTKNGAGGVAVGTALAEILSLCPANQDFVTIGTALAAVNGTTDYIELLGLAGGSAWGFWASGLSSLQCIWMSS
jgi:hypothetical protein